MNEAREREFGRSRAAANRSIRFINTNGPAAASEFNGRGQPVRSSADNNRIVVCQETPTLYFVSLRAKSQAIRMTTTTVRLMPTCCVPTVQAAILIVWACRTLARCMSAFFGRLFVTHSHSPLLIIFLAILFSLNIEKYKLGEGAAVDLSLRSRRKHKAWGVSPRTGR